MRKRQKIIAWGLTASVAAAAFPFHDAVASPRDPSQAVVDPLSLYGEEIDFDVYREGDKVGFHSVRFSGDASDLIVVSNFQLQIDVLFFTAFRYRYLSESQWRQGELQRLKVTVDDDGKASTLDVFQSGKRLGIENADKAYTTDAPLFPTDHWNPEVLSQTRVLNTLTGQINNVQIEPRARETVRTERGNVLATRYAYTGELETEVWYDDAGRWVKMRFEGGDGSMIEYVCRRCQGPRGTEVEK